MSDSTPDQAAVVKIMEDQRFCMLTTYAAEGDLHSHPMTPQEIEEDGDAWFFLDTTSETAANLRTDPRVNLAFGDASTWLSVAGHGELLRDDAKIDDLWNPMVEAWFPDGKDSPDLTLLHVSADSAQYWDTPGGRVASALAFVRTKVTGDRPPGDSAAVDLG
jgi:general stress protein 26